MPSHCGRRVLRCGHDVHTNSQHRRVGPAISGHTLPDHVAGRCRQGGYSGGSEGEMKRRGQWRIAIGIIMVLSGIRTVIEPFDGASQVAGAVILIAGVAVAIWGGLAYGPSNKDTT